MLYYEFLAMSEDCGEACAANLNANLHGLTEAILVPGKSYDDAERKARIILGARYRGATTVPVTRVLTVRF